MICSLWHLGIFPIKDTIVWAALKCLPHAHQGVGRRLLLACCTVNPHQSRCGAWKKRGEDRELLLWEMKRGCCGFPIAERVLHPKFLRFCCSLMKGQNPFSIALSLLLSNSTVLPSLGYFMCENMQGRQEHLSAVRHFSGKLDTLNMDPYPHCFIIIVWCLAPKLKWLLLQIATLTAPCK